MHFALMNILQSNTHTTDVVALMSLKAFMDLKFKSSTECLSLLRYSNKDESNSESDVQFSTMN